MKLHTDPTSALNTVTAYGDGYIEINQVRYDHAVAFGPEGPVAQWHARSASEVTTTLLRDAAGLKAAPVNPLDFLDAGESAPAPLPDNAPEVMLVGTGAVQRFLPAAVTAPLLAQGIGIEVMDTQAAARTYNILMAEGRRVVAALIPTGE